MTLYPVLADVVLVVHALFIAFVLFGGLLVLRWRSIAWLHLPAVAWAVLLELFGWLCPLTPLELKLRHLAGTAGYRGGFIEHYLVSIIYPAGLTREIQLWLAAVVIMMNVAVYAVLWRRCNR